jgi:hypothetical protein
MRRVLVSLLLVFAPLVWAQDPEPPPQEGSSPSLEGVASSSALEPPSGRLLRTRHSLETGFLAWQVTRPGGFAGYSFRALETRSGGHALVVGADIGGYHWAYHDTGLLVLPRVSWRGRLPVGFQGEVSLHLGYLQGFLPSPNYEVVDGEVQQVAHPGYPYFVVGPTVGMGWFIRELGITPFVRMGAMWQMPVFDLALLRLNWMAGVEVRF